MKKWFFSQLTEPSAWICFIIAVMVLCHVPRDYILIVCAIGIALDEEWMKAKCAQIAPRITKKINDITGE